MLNDWSATEPTVRVGSQRIDLQEPTVNASTHESLHLIPTATAAYCRVIEFDSHDRIDLQIYSLYYVGSAVYIVNVACRSLRPSTVDCDLLLDPQVYYSQRCRQRCLSKSSVYYRPIGNTSSQIY